MHLDEPVHLSFNQGHTLGPCEILRIHGIFILLPFFYTAMFEDYQNTYNIAQLIIDRC